MPTYDYACPSCGGFDAFRSLSERNEPAACPDCGTASPRVLACAPRLALMASQVGDAFNTKTRVNPDAVWNPGFLPTAAELNVLPRK